MLLEDIDAFYDEFRTRDLYSSQDSCVQVPIYQHLEFGFGILSVERPELEHENVDCFINPLYETCHKMHRCPPIASLGAP